MKVKCNDCGQEFDVPPTVEENEVVQCPCCCKEMEWKKGCLVDIEIEGEDWGE